MMEINVTQLADLGMPVAGRVRVAPLRRLPASGAVAAAWVSRASVQHVDSSALFTGTDVAVITDAFPGTSAWSPPI